MRKIHRKARQALLPGTAAYFDLTDRFHAAPPPCFTVRFFHHITVLGKGHLLLQCKIFALPP